MANEMRDQLFELLTDCEIEYAQYLYEECNKAIKGDVTKQLFKRFEFYADYLIENGVIVLPCKFWKKVYVLYPDPRYNWGNEEISILESSVYGFHYCNGNDGTVELIDSKHHIKWGIDSFGISIFLTKEQAEQKLKELRENAE